MKDLRIELLGLDTVTDSMFSPPATKSLKSAKGYGQKSLIKRSQQRKMRNRLKRKRIRKQRRAKK